MGPRGGGGGGGGGGQGEGVDVGPVGDVGDNEVHLLGCRGQRVVVDALIDQDQAATWGPTWAHVLTVALHLLSHRALGGHGTAIVRSRVRTVLGPLLTVLAPLQPIMSLQYNMGKSDYPYCPSTHTVPPPHRGCQKNFPSGPPGS